MYQFNHALVGNPIIDKIGVLRATMIPWLRIMVRFCETLALAVCRFPDFTNRQLPILEQTEFLT